MFKIYASSLFKVKSEKHFAEDLERAKTLAQELYKRRDCNKVSVYKDLELVFLLQYEDEEDEEESNYGYGDAYEDYGECF